jgi:hypothetical protein
LLLTTPAQDRAPASQQPAGTELQPTQSDSGLLTFHITTREVVLDVIAVDGHNRAVTDLKPAELQIFDQIPDLDSPGKGHKAPPTELSSDPISSSHIIDPSASLTPVTDRPTLRISTSCLDRATLHYQLAYHPGPQGLTPGYHDVRVTSTRRGVHLYYRHRYYIGATTPDPQNLPEKLSGPRIAQLAEQLRQAACYHPPVPSSIALHASLISTGLTDVLRYDIAVDADSLAFISLSDLGRRVQLDYAVCNFDRDGQPINYFSASLNQVLTPVEYARARTHGFPHLSDIPTPPHLGLSRFVVRDLVTGNYGSIDVLFPFANARAPDAAVLAAASLAEYNQAFQKHGPSGPPLRGPVGSFGSVVPVPNSFCGNVYELQGYTSSLPDFRDLDPIASLYAPALDVSNQFFSGTPGIPGVTPRTAWFGVDYHGIFWIREPGDYQFQMISDDGSVLQIDDQRVIDLDGTHTARVGTGEVVLRGGPHTMHVPYYQGLPNEVALQLWVRPPGGTWQLFDIRNFTQSGPPPTTHDLTSTGLPALSLPPTSEALGSPAVTQRISPFSSSPPISASAPTPVPAPTSTPSQPQSSQPSTGSSGAIAPAARDYLAGALKVMQEHAIFPSHIDWRSLRDAAFAKAAGAQTPAETWPAIAGACLQLRRDGQCDTLLIPPSATPTDRANALAVLQSASVAQQSSSEESSSDPNQPRGDLLKVNGKTFAWVAVPGCGSGSLCGEQLRLFLMKAVAANPDGWIIDLRGDHSGELWPLLLALGPLIDEGTIAYSKTEKGGQEWDYSENAITTRVFNDVTGFWFRKTLAQLSAPPLSLPQRPVAVLLDQATEGTGESIAIAFAGRKGEPPSAHPPMATPSMRMVIRSRTEPLSSFSWASKRIATGIFIPTASHPTYSSTPTPAPTPRRIPSSAPPRRGSQAFVRNYRLRNVELSCHSRGTADHASRHFCRRRYCLTTFGQRDCPSFFEATIVNVGD